MTIKEWLNVWSHEVCVWLSMFAFMFVQVFPYQDGEHSKNHKAKEHRKLQVLDESSKELSDTQNWPFYGCDEGVKDGMVSRSNMRLEICIRIYELIH